MTPVQVLVVLVEFCPVLQDSAVPEPIPAGKRQAVIREAATRGVVIREVRLRPLPAGCRTES